MTSRVCLNMPHYTKLGYCKLLGQLSVYDTPRAVSCMQLLKFSTASEAEIAKKYNLSKEKLQRLRKGFEMFDLNKDGKITKNEFHMAAHNMGLKQFAVQQMEHWFQYVDKDASGEIEFDEYIQLMEEEPCGWLGMIYSDPKAMVDFCYSTFDKYRDGILTKKQVGDMLRYIRGTATDKEIEDFMAVANIKKDGNLTKPELLNVFTKKTKNPFARFL